jgi:hypothetical protein
MVSVLMSYTGMVENGKVTLPPEAQFSDGTKGPIERVEPAAEAPTLADSLREFIGAFDDLPADFARKSRLLYSRHAPQMSAVATRIFFRSNG